MSWIFNCCVRNEPCQDLDLDVELRIATEADDDFSSSSVSSCSLSMLSKAVTSIVSPILVSFRTVADFALRKTPDLAVVSNWYTTNHFSKNPSVMRVMLKDHRNDPSEKGLFSHARIGNVMTSTINKIFTLEEGEPSAIQSNDGIMTCDPENTQKYRHLLREFFSPQSIKRYFLDIEMIVDDVLKGMEDEYSEVILNDKAKLVATSVMLKLFLGDLKPSNKIVKAISNIVPWLTNGVASQENYVYKFITTLFPRFKALSEEDKIKTANILRDVVAEAIKKTNEEGSPDSIIKEMLQKKYTENQIKAMIVTLFVAGQDNVSTSLTEAILKLAQNQGLQKKISEERVNPMDSPLIRSLLCESLRMLCPVGGIGRDVLKDLVLTIKSKTDGEILSKTFIKKGDGINPQPFFAGKDASLFKDPDTFDYDRFLNAKPFLPHLTHLPFGSGEHLCPGWYVYYATAAITVSQLCKNYRVSTTFKGEPTPKAGFVTGIKDQIPITLKCKPD